MSPDLIAKVEKTLSKVEIPDRSTFFQLKNFVLGSEPTGQGQLWACVRNIKDRRDQIESLDLEIENSDDDLELLKIDVKRMEGLFTEVDYWDEEKTIRVRKLKRQIKGLEKEQEKLRDKRKYILQELDYLVVAYETLEKALGGIKPLDDPEVQKEYWNEKLTQELNLRFMLKNPVGTELVATILSLDDDMRVKQDVIKILQNVQSEMAKQNTITNTANVDLVKAK